MRVADFVAIDLDSLSNIFELDAEREAQHPESALRGQLERLWIRRGDPNRRMRFLNRLGNHRHRRFNSPVLAMHREWILAPHPRDRLDRLGPSWPRLFGTHAEAEQLIHRGRAAGAELDAAVRHDVEHRDPFRNVHGMTERQHYDPVSDANLFGALSHAREEDFRRRAIRKLVQEMMLDGPHRVVAEPVGELDLRHGFPEDAIFVIGGVRPYRLDFIDESGLHFAALHRRRNSRAWRRSELRRSNRGPCRYHSIASPR